MKLFWSLEHVATLQLLLVCTLFPFGYSAETVLNYITSNDISHFQNVFRKGIFSNEIQSVYYSVLNYADLKKTEIDIICKNLSTLYKTSKLNEFEKNAYASGINEKLKCKTELLTIITEKTTASLLKTPTSISEIYFNLLSAKHLHININSYKRNLGDNLKSLLTKDDSLLSLGYAFSIGTELVEFVKFLESYIEDAMARADEVNKEMLQFEGGVSVTSLIVTGALRTIKALKISSAMDDKQAAKFATYFLSRRTVQTAKSAHAVLEAIKALSESDNIAPICIQHIGNGQLLSESPVLHIRIVNLLGGSLKTPLKTIHGKIIKKKSNEILAEKIQFVTKSSDNTIYAADLTTFNPQRGLYTLEVSAEKYFHSLPLNILGKIKVHSLNIEISEVDVTSVLKQEVIPYPTKSKEIFNLDNTQKVTVKFAFIDESTNKLTTIQQAFIKLLSVDNNEIIFIAEQDSNNFYKFDMALGLKGAEFNYKSGLYGMEVIVGDALISNPIKWHIADIQLNFGKQHKTENQKSSQYSPLPEIHHKFREPEKRPSQLVSDLFLGFCLLPLIILFVLWIKIGINVSNFTFNLVTLGFHLGFGSILVLFVMFWLKLNMFDTIKYFIPLALFTFLCGNRTLRNIYLKKQVQ